MFKNAQVKTVRIVRKKYAHVHESFLVVVSAVSACKVIGSCNYVS